MTTSAAVPRALFWANRPNEIPRLRINATSRKPGTRVLPASADAWAMTAWVIAKITTPEIAAAAAATCSVFTRVFPYQADLPSTAGRNEFLFDCDRFGEIAWLIDVGAFRNRRVI